ncbi:MAG: NAD(+)/NADH kinase [Anaerolineae bacterium]|jgi:NAD+ kinase|nr:NAD(+)/NADH kinase [Anaerolineae bacterium]
MKNIGLLYNPRVEASLPLAEEISGWLQRRGVKAWICSTHAEPPESVCMDQVDLLITLGGDGTILRTMPLAVPARVPVLGLNLGRVGFLTECTPDHWEEVVTQIIEGQGTVEERTMFQVLRIREGEVLCRDSALNDAVISRGALARTVRLETYIDGVLTTQYVADGVIISTATGSTAYSYAVGGPILPPWSDNILVVPVAAHLSLDRPLVLNADAVVEVKVYTRLPGMLSVDGRMEGELLDGDCVRVERSPLKARFLRLRHREDFYRTLVERLTPRNGV